MRPGVGLWLSGDGTNGSGALASGCGCGGKYPGSGISGGASVKVGTLGGSPTSGASSTDAGGGPVSSCTSGSVGSSAGAASGSGAFGFDSFGSLPSRTALKIRAAFHLANFIFCRTSGSGSPHSRVRSKKVAAASNVSAVCLWPVRDEGQEV